jgi:phosphatidylserine/phosphatidylglycerophosphate/cardiolipin synthase-like enzyme
MAEFLTTSGTSHNIENIIIEAKSQLVLVSPYLQLSKTFYERLKDASIRGVKIIIIYGKDELKPNEKNSLAELKNVELYFFENLHAKCYYNEGQMVITSMNMYEFSEKNNREMGVLINRSIDRDIFEKAMTETFSIIQSAKKVALSVKMTQSNKQVKKKVKWFNSGSFNNQPQGYCIRCEERIEYNPDEPYCTSCFDIWRQFKNYDYKENVCHRCGEDEPTSMAKPQCFNCFDIWRYD